MAYVALTLGLLLVLLVALLAIPLTVMFSISRIEQTRGEVRFRWLFGLVRFQLSIPQDTGAAARPAPTPEKKPKSPGKKSNASGLLSLAGQQPFRRRVYRFIRDLLRATHARNLFLRLRIGLGDPADTGRLWAVVGPIAGMAQNLRNAVVCIEPEFVDPAFEVESHGQFRLVPIQFVALTVAFMLSPTMFRTWRHLRRRKV